MFSCLPSSVSRPEDLTWNNSVSVFGEVFSVISLCHCQGIQPGVFQCQFLVYISVSDFCISVGGSNLYSKISLFDMYVDPFFGITLYSIRFICLCQLIQHEVSVFSKDFRIRFLWQCQQIQPGLRGMLGTLSVIHCVKLLF